ncbi:hypothetical protein XENTR_v10012932 [Xenopus tropicalis]|nr:hypothetical protein XENTR_v10012932 [Xenopus tropicalis]
MPALLSPSLVFAPAFLLFFSFYYLPPCLPLILFCVLPHSQSFLFVICPPCLAWRSHISAMVFGSAIFIRGKVMQVRDCQSDQNLIN